MAWGISSNASELEKLKSEMADFLNGLNATGALSYKDYSEAYDFSMDLLNKVYHLGRQDEQNKKEMME